MTASVENNVKVFATALGLLLIGGDINVPKFVDQLKALLGKSYPTLYPTEFANEITVRLNIYEQTHGAFKAAEDKVTQSLLITSKKRSATAEPEARPHKRPAASNV